MKTTYVLLLSFIILLLMGYPVPAEIETIHQKVDQPFAGSQSPDEARVAAVAKAKFEALEKAGTYLESVSVVEKNILTKEEITAIAAGILKTDILSQQNYATDNGFGMILLLNVQVDSDLLQERVRALSDDRTALKKYAEIQQREKELLSIIQKLEQQNKALKNAGRAGAQDYDAGIAKDLGKAVKALPAAEWNQKAIALWHKVGYSDANQALSYLNESIRLDPDNPKAFNNRGVAYFEMGVYELAVRDYDKAIQLDPAYADALNNRGITLFRLGRIEAAIRDFDQVTTLKPDWVEAYLQRAEAYKNLWQYERALDNYSRAARLKPEADDSGQNKDSALIVLNEINGLCRKAERACRLGLCKARNELESRGFCKQP